MPEPRYTQLPVGPSANSRKWEFKNPLYQRHLELYLDRVAHHLWASGARCVLDAGCGEGYIYRAMRSRGWQGLWIGFDFSRRAVEQARQASPEALWLHASAYSIPLAEKSTDLVLCSQVLEHLTDPDIPLREFARVGTRKILLTVPFEPLFRTLAWVSSTLRLGADPGHINYWTPSAFRAFVSQVGRLLVWERTTVYQIALVEII